MRNWFFRLRAPADFDAETYLRLNHDVRVKNIDPFEHYLKWGKNERRAYKWPEELPEDFDPIDYFVANPDLQGFNINPAAHYLKHGKREGRLYRQGNSLNFRKDFDEKWYVAEYPELCFSEQTPRQHFETIGVREGRHPRFDPAWYLSQYGDVAAIDGLDPYEHYRTIGKYECRHPAFHYLWYLQEYEDVRVSGLNPLDHYLKNGKAEGRHPGFCGQWYLDQYRDVADADLDPYSHYTRNGWGEGRYPAFHREWYCAEYPDVKSSGLDCYAHFRQIGFSQGRRPAPKKNDALAYKVRLSNFPSPYDAQYEAEQDFSNCDAKVKAIAFYLPQFHECHQNNEFWGHGFTEWSNTKSSAPRFDGHYQPRKPHKDIGYYDLSDPSVMRSQADMARRHGIYGFCFYYYWFSGERVLEKPVDLLLANRDIDLPFMLCWANENWTRAWNGLDDEILIEQKYRKDDPLQFIQDITPYLDDPRYIRIGNKPIIMVYRPHGIPDVGNVFAVWRRYWTEKRGTDLLIWCNQTNPSDRAFNSIDAEIDAVVEFPPHVIPHSNHNMRYLMDETYLGLNTSGHFFDYRHAVDEAVNGINADAPRKLPLYKSAMLGWDNSARREDGWSIWFGFSLDYYYKWLRHNIEYTRKQFSPESRFTFINAWNEWAEGTYLEPDQAYGYASLNTTSRALFGLPPADQVQVLPVSRKQIGSTKLRVGVHTHFFFEDLSEELLSYMNRIPQSFDLFITTDSHDKASDIESLFRQNGAQARLQVTVVPNKGRDVAPFLVQVGKELLSYEVVGHFHSKKSGTVSWGDRWRRFLLDNLLGSEEGVAATLNAFESNKRLGLIYSPAYPLIEPHLGWGDVKERSQALLSEIGLDIKLPDKAQFPAGNMFWARSEAIRSMLEHPWKWEDFETEAGQIGQTTAHSVERLWKFAAAASGFTATEALHRNRQLPSCRASFAASSNQRKRLIFFLHFDPCNEISEADFHLIRNLAEISTYIFVMSNSDISDETQKKLAFYVQRIEKRPNAGFDFGGWRDSIRSFTWRKMMEFDEVVFINNSCLGPIFPLTEMFARMDEEDCDFWGVTGFPEAHDSPRPEANLLEANCIFPHIQSYFIVVKKHVVASPEFFRFWETVEDAPDFMTAVTSYEMRFTHLLSMAGYKWKCYIPESLIMQDAQKHAPRFNAIYNKPIDMVMLRTPLLKKRAKDYAPADMDEVRRLVRDFGFYPPHLI